jgi:hypothetical protein
MRLARKTRQSDRKQQQQKLRCFASSSPWLNTKCRAPPRLRAATDLFCSDQGHFKAAYLSGDVVVDAGTKPGSLCGYIQLLAIMDALL